ncbi:MAG: membrane protein insertase YidC [Alphaproteobacteria bacterium]|nr:membrane protein insertase YidC [Alphaproteobacteria bacterium]
MIDKRDNDTEQRALMAILLSLVVFWTWSAFFGPKHQPPGPEDAPTAQVDPVPSVAPPPTPAVSDAPVPERTVDVQTSELVATLSSNGGGLHGVVLPNHQAAYEVTPVWTRVKEMVQGETDGSWQPYGSDPGPEHLTTTDGVIMAAGAGDIEPGAWRIEGSGPWVATRTTADGVRITKTWQTTADPNLLQVDVRFENVGGATWKGPLWVGSIDTFVGEASRYSNFSRPSGVADGDLETLDDLSDAQEAPAAHAGPVSWFGVGDRYFLAAAIPDTPGWGQLTFQHLGDDHYGALMVREAELAPGGVEQLSTRLYLGPKDLKRLKELGYDLDEAINLGFFGFFAHILLWLLQAFHGVVGNWGLAIILLTLVVKACFWPLTRKSFVSGRKMQALSPKLNDIREQYKDDPQAAGQAQMKLFAEEGVNPLSGCLPMLVQMPVWFALYSVLLYTSDVYHAEFLYLKDLSSIDPLGALPALVGTLMIIQQRLTPMSPNMDPTQQKMMRLMPLVFVGFMFIFPSGLALYILVNTVLSIVQMWLINRTIPLPVQQATAS